MGARSNRAQIGDGTAEVCFVGKHRNRARAALLILVAMSPGERSARIIPADGDLRLNSAIIFSAAISTLTLAATDAARPFFEFPAHVRESESWKNRVESVPAFRVFAREFRRENFYSFIPDLSRE